MELREIVTGLAERLGWAFVHSLWQGALIGAALAIALAALHRRSAAARHAACLAAFALFAAITAFTGFDSPARLAPASTSPLASTPGQPLQTATQPSAKRSPAPATFPLLDPAPNEPPDLSPAAVPTSANLDLRERVRPWLPWLAAIWCGGVVLLSLRHAGGWWRIRHWRRTGVAVSPELDAVFRELPERFSIHARVLLRSSARAIAPMLTGIFKPIILLPAQVVSGLSPAELRAVLAHELAHLARRDAWSNLFQIVIETLFFYHPVVWWISRRARTEREHAADDLALAVCADRRAYAGALVRLAELQSAPAFAVAANGGSLVQRVRRIVIATPREPVSSNWLLPGAVVAIVAFIGLILGAIAQDAPVIEVKPGDSIQKAIDTAAAGSVIRIPAGIWKERLTIIKPLTIEGAGWDKTILQPDQHDPEKEKLRKAFQELTKGNRGGTVEGTAPKVEDTYEPTIAIANTSGVNIRRLGIKGLLFAGRDVKDGLYPDPLVSFSKARGTVANCVIAGYYRGVDVSAESGAQLRNTLIAGMWSQGVYVASGGQLHFAESEARNCRYAGIVLGRRCDDSIVERSRISGSAWHGLRYDHASPTIRGNVFFNNARTDVYASGESQAAILDNVFLSGGIWCLGDNRSTVQGNTFAGPNASLSASHGAQVAVAKNVFLNQDKAISYFPPAGWDQPAGPEVFVKLADNFFWKTKTAFQFGTQPQPLPPGNHEADPHSQIRRQEIIVSPTHRPPAHWAPAREIPC